MLKRVFHPHSPLSFLLLLGMAAGWSVLFAILPLSSLISRQLPAWLGQTVVAQPVLRSDDVWRKVYQLVPDLPLENQYVNTETREVSQNNTLVSRLIRYHIYTKGRTPVYRLDWKLTLADYLGVNERIAASVYPGADALKTNPLDGDIAAIQRLTRTQRDALVQALVTVFSPAAPGAESQQPSSPASSVPAALPAPASPQPASPREPRPGDAQLLIP
jgi:hypothetical protein